MLHLYHLGAITVLILLCIKEKTSTILLSKNLNMLKNMKSNIVISKGKKFIQYGQIKWNNFKIIKRKTVHQNWDILESLWNSYLKYGILL